MGKKVGLSVLILIVSSCVLLSVALVVGGYFLFKAQKNYVAPTMTVATEVPTQTAIISTPVPTADGTTSIDPTPTVELPAEIRSQMDDIQRQVLDIRGLPLKTELQRDLMTPAQLQDKVINDFFADYSTEEARDDVKVLSTLGLVQTGFDLRQFYLDLYSEQIAGFYDSETKEMYVIAGDAFGGMERMTYAHEFNHVLQDQNYDLENGLMLNDDYCETDTEYCAAVTALIEGDSTLSEQYWFLSNGNDQDREDIIKFQQSYSSPVYDSAPAYMQADFLFPYQEGYTFVEYLFGKNRWDSVDAAFKDPPVSTEQILHPEKYPKDAPVVVEMPDFSSMLGTGWMELDRNVMGEWYTYLILAKGRSPQFAMDDEDSKTSAAGWGGDTYVFYKTESGTDYLFVWRSTWDTQRDATEFFTLSQKYGMARWSIPDSRSGDRASWTSDVDGRILMRQEGSDVLWVMGSSTDLTNQAVSLIQDFNN